MLLLDGAYVIGAHRETGVPWPAEIGPTRGDEVDILLPGPQLRLAARLEGQHARRCAERRATLRTVPAWASS